MYPNPKVLRPLPQPTTWQRPPETLRQRHQILVLPPMFRLHHPLPLVLPNNLRERCRHHPLFAHWHSHLQRLSTRHPLPLLPKHLLRNSRLSLCHPLIFQPQNFPRPRRPLHILPRSHLPTRHLRSPPRNRRPIHPLHNQLRCPCRHLIGVKASNTGGISHTSLIISPHSPDYPTYPSNFASATSRSNPTR